MNRKIRRTKRLNEPNPIVPGGVKSGEKHAWAIEEIPKFKVTVPIVNSMTMYLSEFNESKINLAALLNDLKHFGPEDKIKLIFNSPGGLISEGRALINAVLGTRADIQTEILSEASSMAAVTFCIGDRRIIYENSSLMYHNFSGGFVGKGHELKDYIKHVTKNIGLFTKAYILGLSSEEIYQMIDGKDFWFGAKEMCKRGIATHINIDGIEIPAKQYLKALRKSKKLCKKEGVRVSTITEALLYGIDVLNPIVEAQNKRMLEATENISAIVGQNELLYN